MFIRSCACAAAAIVSLSASVQAGTISIIDELGPVSSGLSGSVDVTESIGVPLNYYSVGNNSNGDLLGIGISAINSQDTLLDNGNGTVDDIVCDFFRGNNWCYAALLLDASNWGTEFVEDQEGYLVNQTFQDVFGDITNYLTGDENTINWYFAVDGAMTPGATSSGYFAWASELPASNIIGIGSTGTGAAAFAAGSAGPTVPAVPLPAAGWLLLGGIGGLAALRRRKKAA